MTFPNIPEGDLPDTRGADGKWHIGCMITQRRAIAVASKLFPDEFTDGSDCRMEIGREGLPCSVCVSRNQDWSERVAQVRRALLEAFL